MTTEYDTAYEKRCRGRDWPRKVHAARSYTGSTTLMNQTVYYC